MKTYFDYPQTKNNVLGTGTINMPNMHLAAVHLRSLYQLKASAMEKWCPDLIRRRHMIWAKFQTPLVLVSVFSVVSSSDVPVHGFIAAGILSRPTKFGTVVELDLFRAQRSER